VDSDAPRWRRRLLNSDPSEQRSVTPVFFLTLGVLAVMPYLVESAWGRGLTTALIGLSAVVALNRSGARASVRHGGLAVVALLAVAGAAGQVLSGGDDQAARTAEALGAALLALLLLVTPLIVVARLLARPRVTLDTVGGALAAYLQIGLFFATAFRLVDLVTSGPFFAQTDSPDVFDFTYFSFTTITTTGYGDLSPAQPSGQSLANLEAVLGQVFLVTVVALIVSNLGRALPHRTGGGETGGGETGAPPGNAGGSPG
jgi:hypothetical protein